jgi:predicted lipid-binding transport protein (Tim44 family)
VKKILLSLCLAVSSMSMVAVDVQAKRLGGGGTSGMQRQMPAKPTPTSPPAQQAAPAGAGAAAAAPAAAGKRSWMGPIAGLAAGLGIAALMSHLGMGEAFGNFLMMALLAVAAVFAIRFLLRRFGPAAGRGAAMAAPQGMQFAGAGAPTPASSAPTGFGSGSAGTPERGLAATSVVEAPATVNAAPSLPAGFDGAAFERIAKLIFIRMQAANDKADLEDLRQFATPEMFAVFKLDLQDRKDTAQQTDVVQLDAQVIDFAQEAARQTVSVRFHGLIREEAGASATPFDEVWHLVKPTDGSREWAIAGIAQYA